MSSLNLKPNADKGQPEEIRTEIGKRRGGALLLTRGSHNGKPSTHLRFYFARKEDGLLLPTGRGCTLQDEEIPVLIHALQELQAKSGNMPCQPQKRLSYQDQALLHLYRGCTPEELAERLSGGKPRRIIELGKALRRMGLLETGTWALTPEGRARAERLHETWDLDLPKGGSL